MAPSQPLDAGAVAAHRELLREASGRLVRTVDGLSDDALAGPSRLPGWTRAHVVAHLALNAEALAGCLRGVLAGETVPMYPSQEARDDDIEELGSAAPADLRSRLLAGVTEFDEAAAAVPGDGWEVRIERTPGSDRSFRAGAAVAMRLREVEIHHVDLDAGYTHQEWPAAFAALVLESMARREAADRPFTAVPDDLAERFEYGAGGADVHGTAADLAWWVTGRGSGEGVTGDGPLPTIRPW